MPKNIIISSVNKEIDLQQCRIYWKVKKTKHDSAALRVRSELWVDAMKPAWGDEKLPDLANFGSQGFGSCKKSKNN
ncbi:MAG: hypothetical protein PVF13_07180 [Chromatiales bacterium]